MIGSSSATSLPSPTGQKVFDFDADDSEKNILLVDEEGDLAIKGATLAKLIERLTSEKYMGTGIETDT